jgi:hypothetical protein
MTDHQLLAVLVALGILVALYGLRQVLLQDLTLPLPVRG